MASSGCKGDCKNPPCHFADIVLAASSGRPAPRFYYCIMKSGIRAMLSQPWFVMVAVLAFVHQILQKVLGVSLPLADSLLDPLLFLPILLHLMLLERRFIFGKGAIYVLSWYHIVGTVVLVSIICENFFPHWSEAFTSDYKDVICYALGGAVFGFFLNSPCKDPGR